MKRTKFLNEEERRAGLKITKTRANKKYQSKPEVKEHNRLAQKARRSTPEGRAYAKIQNDSRRLNQPEQTMLDIARRCAKVKGLPCTLTKEDIKIPSVCPVYGTPLTWVLGGRSPDKPSLDRVDNTKGYTPDNVHVISWRANQHKRDMSLEQILQLAEYVLAHQRGAL
jgi:hypothetical protein